MGTEVYVLAVRRVDGTLPKESKILNDAFYHSVEEAQVQIPPEIAHCTQVYKALIQIVEPV